MIYYCMLKDICQYKECLYQKVNSEHFSKLRCTNLIVNGFNCSAMDNKKVRLVSEERIICDKYQECDIDCLLKTNYLTVNNFKAHFGHKFCLPKSFKCDKINTMVNLKFAGKSINSYVNIWD